MGEPLTTQQYEQRIKDAIAKFPETFGLRAFPGKVFKISFSASYIAEYDSDNPVELYTLVKVGDRWESFCKGTVAELQANIVKL